MIKNLNKTSSVYLTFIVIRKVVSFCFIIVYSEAIYLSEINTQCTTARVDISTLQLFFRLIRSVPRLILHNN